MSSKSWRRCRLGDVVELQRGFDLPERLREDGEVPIVASSGINGFHSTPKVNGPGVVTGRYGSIGRVFYIDRSYWPLNTTLWVKDFKGSDPRFIYYWLQLVDFESVSAKSAVPGINRNDLHEFEAFVPHLDEQRRIASVLGALDDKIARNSAVVQTLHQLEGVAFRATVTGSRDSARVGDVLELRYGKALPESERRGGGVTVYGSNGPIGSHDEALANGPGIVIGRKGNVGSVHWSHDDFFVIDTAFYVAPAPDAPSLLFLFHALREIDWESLNSDSAVPGLNRNAAYDALLRLPIDGTSSFDAMAQPARALAEQFQREANLLAQVRDVLLPKLVSGAIRVPDGYDPTDGHGKVAEAASVAVP